MINKGANSSSGAVFQAFLLREARPFWLCLNFCQVAFGNLTYEEQVL
jgi:hypothetical protein